MEKGLLEFLRGLDKYRTDTALLLSQLEIMIILGSRGAGQNTIDFFHILEAGKCKVKVPADLLPISKIIATAPLPHHHRYIITSSAHDRANGSGTHRAYIVAVGRQTDISNSA